MGLVKTRRLAAMLKQQRVNKSVTGRRSYSRIYINAGMTLAAE